MSDDSTSSQAESDISDDSSTASDSQAASDMSDESDDESSDDYSQDGNGAIRGIKRYGSDDYTNQPPTRKFRQTQDSDCDCSVCEGY